MKNSMRFAFLSILCMLLAMWSNQTVTADARGSAKRVVFLSDWDRFPENVRSVNKVELGRACDGLYPIQSFNVVLFRKGDNSFGSSLTMANPTNKRRIRSWFDSLKADATFDAMAGVETALNQKPDLLYIMVWNDLPDADQLLAKIKEIDPEEKVKVNVIVIARPGERNQDTLKKLTRDTGVLKIIDQNDYAPPTTMPSTAPSTQPIR